MNVPAALKERLAVFAPFLEDADVEDVCVNRPGEVWVNRAGQWSSHELELTFQDCMSIARVLANQTKQIIGDATPELDCTLPGGERVCLCLPPLVAQGTVSISIRRQVAKKLTLDQMARAGVFDGTKIIERTDGRPMTEVPAMARAAAAGDAVSFLKACVAARRNIAVGGGTGAGKTTLMNALISEFPKSDRIVSIEDVAELVIDVPNHVSLIVPYSGHAVSQMTADSALRKAMRMKPDRVLLGECRGSETTAFLRVINSGHPGSITSVHADDAGTVFWKIAMLASEHSANASFSVSENMAKGFIDVSVFVQAISGVGRRVTEIRYV